MQISSEAVRAQEAAIGLILNSPLDTTARLLEWLRADPAKFELVYLKNFGKTQQKISATSVWSLLKHIAEEEEYSMPWAIIPVDNQEQALRVDWKRDQIKALVQLIKDKMYEQHSN